MSIVSRIATRLRRHPAVFDLAKSVHRTVIRPSKYTGELDYWKMRHEEEGGRFVNDEDEPFMRSLLGDTEIDGRVVADFGCGPRGSLAWAADRAHCIGIDILIPRYLAAFEDDLARHNTTYVGCTEQTIPLATASVDVLMTINALDHVFDLDAMCAEMIRIVKPGGTLAGLFNLHEPPTVTEPQTLDEPLLERALFHAFEPNSRCLAIPDKDRSAKPPTAPEGYEGPVSLMWRGVRRG